MQTFQLDMPFDLVKSGTDDEMRIGGYASTEDRDRDGECIIQKSLDISEFVNSGFFNLDHDSSKILGYPDSSKCRIDGHGLYVEGVLLKGVPEAESIYRTAVALKRSGAPRRFGFSVEGKVLARNGRGLITKAKLYNVAVTAMPVNPNCTWDALCKSFAAAEDCDACTDPEPEMAKALSTGSYAQAEGVDAKKDGAALQTEALETSFRNLAHIIGQNEEAQAAMKALRKALQKQGVLSKSEAALYFMLTRGLTLEKSVSLVNTILDEGGNV